MYRILLASTFLTAAAGMAAADVTLSGDARMGLISAPDNPETAVDESVLTFTSRARVTFTLTGESDSGLSFGATFRADNAGSAATGTGGSVFIAGSWGKLSMGDVDGAAKAAVGQVGAHSLTGLGDAHEIVFFGNGGLMSDKVPGGYLPNKDGKQFAVTGDPSWLYEYDAGQVTFYLSGTLPGHRVTTAKGGPVFDPDPNDSIIPVADDTVFEGDAYAVGVTYEGENYTVSAGYEGFEAASISGFAFVRSIKLRNVVVGGSYTLGAMTLRATAARASGTVDFIEGGSEIGQRQYAVSATWVDGPLSVTGFLRRTKEDASLVFFKALEPPKSGSKAYGLGASYDLGGGAAVTGGVARVESSGLEPTSDTTWDLGVTLTF